MGLGCVYCSWGVSTIVRGVSTIVRGVSTVVGVCLL